jgi:hypothetical protein
MLWGQYPIYSDSHRVWCVGASDSSCVRGLMLLPGTVSKGYLLSTTVLWTGMRHGANWPLSDGGVWGKGATSFPLSFRSALPTGYHRMCVRRRGVVPRCGKDGGMGFAACSPVPVGNDRALNSSGGGEQSSLPEGISSRKGRGFLLILKAIVNLRLLTSTRRLCPCCGESLQTPRLSLCSLRAAS